MGYAQVVLLIVSVRWEKQDENAEVCGKLCRKTRDFLLIIIQEESN